LIGYLSVPWLQYVFQFFSLMASFNICLALFNLIPIPPLDGYHVLNDLVFKGKLQLSEQMWYALRILLFVLCMTGAFSGFLNTEINAIQTPLLNLFITIFF